MCDVGASEPNLIVPGPVRAEFAGMLGGFVYSKKQSRGSRCLAQVVPCVMTALPHASVLSTSENHVVVIHAFCQIKSSCAVFTDKHHDPNLRPGRKRHSKLCLESASRIS